MYAIKIKASLAIGMIITSFSGLATAQTMTTSYSTYEKGYGTTSRGQYEAAVDVSTRDANGNRVLVDGVIQTGWDSSAYNHTKTMGAGDTYSGAGALGGATAIGNNLQVIVNGNYNTVNVHSVQTNNGNVTATVNGKSVTAPTNSQIVNISGPVAKASAPTNATDAAVLNGSIDLGG